MKVNIMIKELNMRGKMVGVFFAMVLCLVVISPAAASTIGFTGNPAQDNWVLQGNSLTLGTYIRGDGSMDFNVYSSAFSLDATSPLVGGNWQVGDLILGLGGVPQGTSNDNHHPRMVAKFGADTANFTPSTLPSPDGNGLGSFSDGDAGTGGIQIDYKYLLDNGVWTPNADMNGVILTPDHVYYYNGSASVGISTDFGRVRALFQEDSPDHYILQSFEVALNLSYLSDPSRGNYSPSPSLHGKADMAWQIGSGDYTDAYVPNMGANVPAPGTLVLLGSGLVGLACAVKKKKI